MLKEFGSRMDDPVALERCDCLPDCEEIKYETQESGQTLTYKISIYLNLNINFTGGHFGFEQRTVVWHEI